MKLHKITETLANCNKLKCDPCRKLRSLTTKWGLWNLVRSPSWFSHERSSSTNTYSVFDSGSTLYWFKRIFILILIIYCHCKGVVHYPFKRFGGSHVTVENFLRPWAFIQQGRPIPSCPLFQPQESFGLRVCQPLWWVSILHWKMSYHSTNGFLYPCSIIFHAFNTGLVSSKKSNHSFICLQRYNVHKIYDDSGFIFSCPSPVFISLPEPAYAQGRHQAIKPLSQI